MGAGAATGTIRQHTCPTCGLPLGVVTRAKGGPTVLTPYPGVTLAEITGGVVWLLCPCGQRSPWFCVARRQLRETG
jgi:hypothetical protein